MGGWTSGRWPWTRGSSARAPPPEPRDDGPRARNARGGKAPILGAAAAQLLGWRDNAPVARPCDADLRRDPDRDRARRNLRSVSRPGRPLQDERDPPAEAAGHARLSARYRRARARSLDAPDLWRPAVR